ncbi:ATP-binding cassette domain-containing protein [Chromobacterium piscinae]|uniref:ABC transporter ATP-binding protein n=1 Tax=Chromobacterium piscinae TaxID=686831 RepID=UPI001E646F25|nr:ATP-binding cassette domain-containing protein [Chromobacterium piscinae]MCD5327082.1 ATP-binding cassette domain-containing protein [Chromobacterium piscinae]
MIEIANVNKAFHGAPAVTDLSLTVAEGEFAVLVGTSGSGKSTMLKMLNRLLEPDSGDIRVAGRDIRAQPPELLRRHIGYAIQSVGLFPHWTVEQNIAAVPQLLKWPRQRIQARVDELLALLQLPADFRRRYPHQLSGGQQQRVALARSLVKRPKLLLLDEPLGALDKKLRQQTQLELVNTIEAVGVTCIMVTHDQEEAMTMSSRIGIMSEGKLLQVGTPTEIYEYPSCRFTAEFIGETNMFEGAVVVDEPDRVEINSQELGGVIHIDHGITGPKGMHVWASVRPEDVRLDKQPLQPGANRAAGTVRDIAYLGSYSVYHVKLAGGKIVKAVVPSSRWCDANETAPTWDETVYLSWRADSPVVLTQ